MIRAEGQYGVVGKVDPFFVQQLELALLVTCSGHFLMFLLSSSSGDFVMTDIHGMCTVSFLHSPPAPPHSLCGPISPTETGNRWPSRLLACWLHRNADLPFSRFFHIASHGAEPSLVTAESGAEVADEFIDASGEIS